MITTLRHRLITMQGHHASQPILRRPSTGLGYCWAFGTGVERVRISKEMEAAAQRAGDVELRIEAVLLQATMRGEFDRARTLIDEAAAGAGPAGCGRSPGAAAR